MKTFNLFLSSIIFLFFVGCSEDLVEKELKGTIKGVVVAKGTNTPIANAKISTSPSTSSLFTKSDGTFEITDVALGDYSVKAEASGYVASFQGINLKSEAQTVNIIFELADDNSLNSPPTVPVLVSPADNSENQPLSVNLTWTCTDPDQDDVLKYDLIIKNSINTSVLNINDISATNYTLNNLQFGVTYFWQVVVSDGVNPKVYSEIKQFKTSSTPNNRFHYAKKANGNYYLVSTDEAGNNFSVTSQSQNSFRPRLNNDANKIAFLRNVGGNFQIFTAKRDGSDITQVTNLPVTGFNNAEIDFSWNTNGNQFIYANFNKLYRINSDGTGLTLLYTTTDGSLISECDWSYDGSKIVLKTNGLNGYGVKIFIIDMAGNVTKTVLSSVTGGAGGINFSIDGKKLLYTRDVSGFEDVAYRQLDSRIFIYNLENNTEIDLSNLSQKSNGTNDLDPRFSPNDSEVIFVNTSNDNISPKNILKITINYNNNTYLRTTLFTNAEMPDWE